MHTIDHLNNSIVKYFKDNPVEGEPTELYNPINYILSLGGKRVRPLMLLMSYNLFSDDIETALPLAQAIEVFHNFTLLHDDIMDKAPIRRGKETVHEKWNDNTAILSGDAMLIKAYQIFEFLPAEQLKQILPVFTKTALEVCEGQQFDMEFEERTNVEIHEYINMISLKTSVLLGSSMEIGALAANSNTVDAKNLYDFGKNLGVAFQLQDDYLDLYGDPKKFGKRVGGDVVANKKTFLTLKAFQKADANQKKELESLFSTTNLSYNQEEEKINSVRKIFNDLNVIDDMNIEINKYYNLSIESLALVNVDTKNKKILSNFAEKLIKRDV